MPHVDPYPDRRGPYWAAAEQDGRRWLDEVFHHRNMSRLYGLPLSVVGAMPPMAEGLLAEALALGEEWMIDPTLRVKKK